MAGFIRGSQPAALDRNGVASFVEHFLAEEVEPADPFGIDDPCPNNGGGPHHDIVGCPEIACIHCGRLIWA